MDIIVGDNLTVGDPREDLKKILEKYKVSPKTFGLISGIKEEEVLGYAYKNSTLSNLPFEKELEIGTFIGLLSDGMELVTADERVKAIIEHLNTSFQISNETLALYSHIEKKELNDFLNDSNTLSYEKRYRLAAVVLFLDTITTRYTPKK
ncbi:HTH domain-containing protein [Bacillus massiliigorillae]|uniref:HTH domain-containing protein n=1 Tax=Bacillus massiliigorillae TaxID=1243664 RepID=UPI0003A63D46|nr:HTH domain-containing protein [Bacillus massiliigorillae]